MTMNRPVERDGPLEITTADDLLAKMRVGIKEVYEIRIRDLVVPVRLLTVDELNTIRRESARNRAMKSGDETDENLDRQKAALRIASTVTKGGASILSERLLGMMTVDEITHLYQEYIRVMESANPSLQNMTPEHFRSLVDALKKKAISSRDCSLLQLWEICTAYVDLIQRLEMQNSPLVSSSGGPQTE